MKSTQDTEKKILQMIETLKEDGLSPLVRTKLSHINAKVALATAMQIYIETLEKSMIIKKLLRGKIIQNEPEMVTLLTSLEIFCFDILSASSLTQHMLTKNSIQKSIGEPLDSVDRVALKFEENLSTLSDGIKEKHTMAEIINFFLSNLYNIYNTVMKSSSMHEAEIEFLHDLRRFLEKHEKKAPEIMKFKHREFYNVVIKNLKTEK